jgi:chromodomain-helicase-DNA-binding protein 1
MDVRALTAAPSSYPLPPHRQQHGQLGDTSMDIDPRHHQGQPQNGYASSDADADADYDEDDEDDNEEEDVPQAPASTTTTTVSQSYPTTNGHSPQRIHLPRADQQLYGLRRSVSALSAHTALLLNVYVSSNRAEAETPLPCAPSPFLPSPVHSAHPSLQYGGSPSDASDEDADEYTGARKAPPSSAHGKRKKSSRPKCLFLVNYAHPASDLTPIHVAANPPPPAPAGDDASSDEYGAPSRKRRRPATSGNNTPDVRVSSRGVKIPNYADDGGFRSDEYLEDDNTPGYSYPSDPRGPLQNVTGQGFEYDDEIDGVFGHSRDEDRGMAVLYSSLYGLL